MKLKLMTIYLTLSTQLTGLLFPSLNDVKINKPYYNNDTNIINKKVVSRDLDRITSTDEFLSSDKYSEIYKELNVWSYRKEYIPHTRNTYPTEYILLNLEGIEGRQDIKMKFTSYGLDDIAISYKNTLENYENTVDDMIELVKILDFNIDYHREGILKLKNNIEIEGIVPYKIYTYHFTQDDIEYKIENRIIKEIREGSNSLETTLHASYRNEVKLKDNRGLDFNRGLNLEPSEYILKSKEEKLKNLNYVYVPNRSYSNDGITKRLYMEQHKVFIYDKNIDTRKYLIDIYDSGTTNENLDISIPIEIYKNKDYMRKVYEEITEIFPNITLGVNGFLGFIGLDMENNSIRLPDNYLITKGHDKDLGTFKIKVAHSE